MTIEPTVFGRERGEERGIRVEVSFLDENNTGKV